MLFQKMIRCPAADLTACVRIGSDLTDGTTGGNFMQGIAQIPGSDDILIMTVKDLYRYDLQTGVATPIFDLEGAIANVGQTRHLRIP